MPARRADQPVGGHDSLRFLTHPLVCTEFRTDSRPELYLLPITTSESMAIACFVDYLMLMPTYGFLFLII